jgi:hypothetical protein
VSEVWNAVKSVDAFLSTCVGIERSIEPDAVCPGVDKAWKMAHCGKPGPHGRHRGDEDPPYAGGESR